MSRREGCVRPPKLACRFLSFILPAGVVGEAIRGDLEEEHRLAANRGPVRAARAWYRRQVVGVFSRYLVKRYLARCC